MKLTKKDTPQETYVVINRDSQVFIGLKNGYPNYSDDWSKAKLLPLNNTAMLLRDKGTELIKKSELYN